jgi:hypothetical protein
MSSDQFILAIGADDERSTRLAQTGSGHDPVEIGNDLVEAGLRQDDDGQLPSRQILLVAQILVAGQQAFKSGFHDAPEQQAVLQSAPINPEIRDVESQISKFASQSERHTFIDYRPQAALFPASD